MMSGMLKPGGNLISFMPAGSWAYGTLDKTLLHYSRYSKRRLAKIAERHNHKIIGSRYANFVGVFTWFLVRED